MKQAFLSLVSVFLFFISAAQAAVIYNSSQKTWKVAFDFKQGNIRIDNKLGKQLTLTVSPGQKLMIDYEYGTEARGAETAHIPALQGAVTLTDFAGISRSYPILIMRGFYCLYFFFPYIHHNGNTGPVVLNGSEGYTDASNGGNIEFIRDSWET